ncbi:6-phosphogluconolactonase [Cloeon dipterum]|uniref:6-phosphogluconolactonase n=1 Tax=Cloeon dipterum TaxID=197152 RepID=UPI003220471F
MSSEAPTIVVVKDEGELVAKLASVIEEAANKSIEQEEIFKIGLSGGSLIKFLEKGLPDIKTDWSKWRFFFCDERIVPEESSDSTYGAYKTALIGKVPITEDQFISVNTDLTAEAAAKDYIQKLAVFFSPDCLPKFHMLLLGVGPDGHTCSLFPNHNLLEETTVWVAPITNSPKPPPARITLTFPVLNNAECCVFAMAGAGKADMVKRILVDKENLPAGRVQPEGTCLWILDEAAGAYLKK